MFIFYVNNLKKQESCNRIKKTKDSGKLIGSATKKLNLPKKCKALLKLLPKACNLWSNLLNSFKISF